MCGTSVSLLLLLLLLPPAELLDALASNLTREHVLL
jgi:hypothetical protein